MGRADFSTSLGFHDEISVLGIEVVLLSINIDLYIYLQIGYNFSKSNFEIVVQHCLSLLNRLALPSETLICIKPQKWPVQKLQSYY